MARVPTVVSVDATPLQYDGLGAAYDHRAGNRHIERVKWQVNRTCFRSAVHIVTWSAWAKRGLVDGYGVDPEKITVLPPGVTPSTWHASMRRQDESRPIRILFVGGDLERKGGDLLLRVFAGLLHDADRSANHTDVELHLVTRSDVGIRHPGVIVHRDVDPGSDALIALYRAADIFCLPTRADTLGLVLLEAGAAGLPIVSTSVGAIPEIVRDGQTGLVVPADDAPGLARSLRTLIDDAALRLRLGESARVLVCREYDAEVNTHRLAELLSRVATRKRGVIAGQQGAFMHV
jgi:glycosyltransferase involved in cell wall biosynthesis